MSDLKQYELHFTVAKHVPEEHRHAYPRPAQDVIDRVKPPQKDAKKKAKLDGEVQMQANPDVEMAPTDQPNDTEMTSTQSGFV